MRLEAVHLGRGLAVIADRGRQEMILDIWVLHPRAGAHEGRGLEMVRGAEPGLEEEPFRANEDLRKEPEARVQGDRLAAGLLDIEFQMVLQVSAYAGQVGH